MNSQGGRKILNPFFWETHLRIERVGKSPFFFEAKCIKTEDFPTKVRMNGGERERDCCNSCPSLGLGCSLTQFLG